MTPTDAQLAALAEAAREATPGPWSWSFDGDKSNDWIVGTTDPPHAGFLDASDDAHVGDEHVCSGEDPANARYIAAASPDVVLALLAERERMRAALEEAHDVLRFCTVRDFPAPEDEMVGAIGEQIGYGALIDAASRMWALKLERQGLAGGAFTKGPCEGTVKATLALLRAALGKE